MNDIQVIRGTTNKFVISIMNNDNTPYTLQQDEKIIFGVKQKPFNNNYNIKKISNDINILLEPEDTIHLDFGTYYYDVGLESEGQFFIIIPMSKFIIKENITKHGDAL